jgi:hypothetical protein
VEIPKKTLSRRKYKNRILICSTLNKVKRIESIFPIIKKLNYQFDIFDHGKNAIYYKKIAPKNINFIRPVAHSEIQNLILKHPLVIGQQTGSMGVFELESMSLARPTLFPFKYNNAYSEILPMPEFNRASIVKYFGDANLGERQRSWVKKHHATNKVVRKLIFVYKKVLNEV